jgi:hypothetical protein
MGGMTSGGVGGAQGGVGNTGGTLAGRGGRGGSAGHGGGGMGGTSGGGMSGGGMGQAGCSFDLDTNPMHCGSCTNACGEGVACEGGKCITSPCVGICEPATQVPLKQGDGYRVEPMPMAGGCYEVASYTPQSGGPALVCWNDWTGRTLELNGDTFPCQNGSGAPLTAPRAGGYCVKVGTTTNTCTTCYGFVFPLSSSLPKP